jgi:hypothetical protein
LRGGSGARDATIHRVSVDAGGFVCSVTEGKWIATGFAFAMTRVEEVIVVNTLCHCEEDRIDDAAIHRV